MHTSIYIPDFLWRRAKTELGVDETVSGLATAALAARLTAEGDCPHEHAMCSRCHMPLPDRVRTP